VIWIPGAGARIVIAYNMLYYYKYSNLVPFGAFLLGFLRFVGLGVVVVVEMANLFQEYFDLVCFVFAIH
jgi:hypothetical protein